MKKRYIGMIAGGAAVAVGLIWRRISICSMESERYRRRAGKTNCIRRCRDFGKGCGESTHFKRPR